MAKTVKSIIRYDGPALAEHEMDVYALAPALLALGDLCRTANSIVNGDMASVKVLVRADIEQQCFQLQFELVQTLYEQVTALLDQDRIKDAKNILEWLGIIYGGSAVAGGTLFGLYKFLAKRKKDDKLSVTTNTSIGSVTYQIIGNGNSITVPREVDAMARDQRSLKAVQGLLAPLQREGYDRLEFDQAGKAPATLFTREQAQEILALAPDDVIIAKDGEQISRIHTTVRVRKAIMEGDATWGINYRKAVEAKMLDEQWLSDYQAGRVPLPPRSKLIVDLEETAAVDESGMQTGTPTYKILKVHGVELPPEQYELIPPESSH